MTYSTNSAEEYELRKVTMVGALMARRAIPSSAWKVPPVDPDALDDSLCDNPQGKADASDRDACAHCGYPVCHVCQEVHVPEFSGICSPCREIHPDNWEADPPVLSL